MKQILVLVVFLSGICMYSQETFKDLSNTEKIYGLSKIWKEADKNFVFFDQVPALDWDETYQTYINKVLKTESTYQYYKTLQEFISLLHDGHTRVVVPWQLRKTLEVSPPIATEIINNKVYISKVLNDTLNKQGIAVGMEIIKIDGIKVHKYANEKVKPFVFYSTNQDMLVQVYERRLLEGNIAKPISLTFSNGKTISIKRSMSKRVKKH